MNSGCAFEASVNIFPITEVQVEFRSISCKIFLNKPWMILPKLDFPYDNGTISAKKKVD
jgi:hypothetical protein